MTNINTVSVLILNLLILINSYSVACNSNNKDLNIVKERCRLLLLSDTVYATEQSLLLTDDLKYDTNAAGYLNSISTDGSWKDIDYMSEEKNAWIPSWHLYRLMLIYRAYNKNRNHEYLNAVHKGLSFWIKNDFKCVNWWHNQINVPFAYTSLMIMLGKDASKHEISYLDETILKRYRQASPTGQNRIWQDDIEARIALIHDDPFMLDNAIRDMEAVISISTNEGIQPDYSFHQHGPMLQFGNYGLHFVNSILYWITVTSNTNFSFAQRKQKILFDYCSKGLRWTIYKKAMDITALGRQFRPNCDVKRGRNLYDDFNLIKTFFTNTGCRFSLDGFETPRSSCNISGNKNFWRSGYMVQMLGGKYFMSVKTNGNFVLKIESINGENCKGAFLNDGVCLIQRTGIEYRNIEPLWNWTMLPGITCDTTLNPSDRQIFNTDNKSEFVGQISDGKKGFSSMYYNRLGVKAYKSYFFVSGMMVALGAGIGSGNLKNIVTTVNQRFLNNKRPVSFEKYNKDIKCLWHDSIAYFFPENQNVYVRTEARKGDWIDVDKAWGHQTECDSLITIYISHQKNDFYSYIIMPDIGLNATKKLSTDFPVKILSNSKHIQAIKIGKVIMAAFFQPSVLKISHDKKITVNKPCLIMFEQKGGKNIFYVSDPTRKLKILNIGINNELRNIFLPEGEYAGSTKAIVN